MSTKSVLATSAGILGLVALVDWTYANAPQEIVSSVVTLLSTFLGVALAAYIGIRRYRIESQEQDEDRANKIAQSLAGESFAVLDVLAGPPDVTVLDPIIAAGPQGQTPVPIKVVYGTFVPTATDEAIRIGLFGSQSASNLTQMANLMRDYTRVSNNLYPRVVAWQEAMKNIPSNMPPPPSIFFSWQSVHAEAKELERLKANLVIWCATTIYGLAYQGVSVPDEPLYRSRL